jgi:hypothetical protein
MVLLNSLVRLVRRPASPRRLQAKPLRRRPLGLELLEDRSCPSTLIDATALSSTIPILTMDSGAASLNTSAAQAFDLAPGTHSLSYATGASVTFRVAAGGNVDFSTSLDGVLDGRGSSTLTVLGRTVSIDATPLNSAANLLLDEAASFPTASVFTAQLLPGPQRLRSTAGAGGDVSFSVANDGTLGYNPTLEGALTGAGASALGVSGRTVPINATALNADPDLYLDEAVVFPSAAVFNAHLLPGVQSMRGARGTGGEVSFAVANDGTVGYVSTLEGALTGAGTSALGVNGRTVTLNISAFTTTNLFLDEAVLIPAPSAFIGHLLPGVQSLRDAGISGGAVAFTVTNGGFVGYDPTLEGALGGLPPPP